LSLGLQLEIQRASFVFHQFSVLTEAERRIIVVSLHGSAFAILFSSLWAAFGLLGVGIGRAKQSLYLSTIEALVVIVR
jgi:hypothetical protein